MTLGIICYDIAEFSSQKQVCIFVASNDDQVFCQRRGWGDTSPLK
jgi:hypothetical protein